MKCPRDDEEGEMCLCEALAVDFFGHYCICPVCNKHCYICQERRNN